MGNAGRTGPRLPGVPLLATALLLSWLVACGTATPVPRPEDGQEFGVLEVIDGDTIRLDDGRTVRYMGINTPERGQPYYAEATAANRRLVQGQNVWIVLDVQPTDRYGRLLGYVWVGSTFVNVELVRQGYANAYTEPPNTRYSAEIMEAERAARSGARGLWQPSNASVRIRHIQYDAPGADHLNPNGEWIEVANTGATTVDLTGFVLRDEAAHTYTFPAVLLPQGGTARLYSGQGKDVRGKGQQLGRIELYWGLSGDAVWTNTGDTAYLWDSAGRLVDTYRYP